MVNPATAKYLDVRDWKSFARNPKKAGFSMHEWNGPDEFIREHNIIAAYDMERLVSMEESCLDCSIEERTTHNTMLLHCTRALAMILLAIITFTEGKLHFAVRVKERIVHVCCATITPHYTHEKTRIDQFQFKFVIDLGDDEYQRVSHGFAGVAVAVFDPTRIDEKVDRKVLGISKEEKRLVFVVYATTKEAWNGQPFQERFTISRDAIVDFYKTGRAPSDFPGMCFEKGLRRKVEEFGALDLKWRDDQKGLFPLDMTGRLKMTSYLRKLEPLADALEHSRTTLAEKEAAQEEKLANRKVVKHPDVPKPDDWKPYVPPAPKEKKLKRKEYRTAQNGDYDRPYLTTRRQRRRRDPDGDAEEGEGL